MQFVIVEKSLPLLLFNGKPTHGLFISFGRNVFFMLWEVLNVFKFNRM